MNMRIFFSVIFAVLTILAIWLLEKPYAIVITMAMMVCIYLSRQQNVTASYYSKKQKSEPNNNIFLQDNLTFFEFANVIPDALLVLNRNGDICFINSMAKKNFTSLSEGQNFITRFRAPELVNGLRQCQQQHIMVTVDYLEKNQSNRVFNVAFIALQQQYIMCLFRDHTKTHNMEKMRTDFIANASHELRTPLTSLYGFIKTLQGAAKNDEAARSQFLDIMQDQAERMSRLIDDLLALSRLESKTGIEAPEVLNLKKILDHVVETLQPLAIKNSVVIEQFNCDNIIMISGNRDDLIQLFQNLIENACKYGMTGGKVHINVEDQDTHVAIHIRDFGMGISEEYLPRLTERFYRANQAASHLHKGTGLGLAIVKHILNHHQGKLTIQSKLGEGATFSVVLPKITML